MAMDLPVREQGKYHTYDEMLALLQGWEEAFPEVCTLESIGMTPEGRELWLLTLTVLATGASITKPAFWCEANTHAGEVTGRGPGSVVPRNGSKAGGGIRRQLPRALPGNLRDPGRVCITGTGA